MTRRIPVRFRRGCAGSTTIEFAASAMALMLLVVGIIESGLMFWTWQALEGAAISAARCAAINATSCQSVATTPSNTKSFAAGAALGLGLSGVTSTNVTVLTGAPAQTACGATTAGVVSVAITYNYGPIFMVPLSSALTASACFPLVS